jgi:hypothetical protein
MDDITALERAGHERGRHEMQGPHRDFAPARVPEFVPLRLRLRPDGPCIELTQANALIGRLSAADIRLAAPDVSRRHCLLIFADGHWKVLDLGSLNGVFVNDERMHETTLYDGDRIRVGSATFEVQFRVPSADAGVRHHVPMPEAERRAS